jgi:23S rRNA (pseudouridine1915-N3)-methyltransferase
MLLLMHLTLAHITPKPGSVARSKDAMESLIRLYLERCAGYARCDAEAYRSETALFDHFSQRPGRTLPVMVLLDTRGRSMNSEAFAHWLGARRDEGMQQIVFAVGPADGWSDASRQRANLLLSLGQMTMAHSLARLVLAEQIYRAFTILTGHPYHGGH